MRPQPKRSSRTASQSVVQPAIQPLVQEEIQFRLSLLRLMTVPHEGAGSVSPGVVSRQEEFFQMEQLAMAPVRRAVPGTRPIR